MKWLVSLKLIRGDFYKGSRLTILSSANLDMGKVVSIARQRLNNAKELDKLTIRSCHCHQKEASKVFLLVAQWLRLPIWTEFPFSACGLPLHCDPGSFLMYSYVLFPYVLFPGCCPRDHYYARAQQPFQ